MRVESTQETQKIKKVSFGDLINHFSQLADAQASTNL